MSFAAATGHRGRTSMVCRISRASNILAVSASAQFHCYIRKLEAVDHNQMTFEDPGLAGSDENQSFRRLIQPLNFSAKRILLIEFDMCAAKGVF